MIFLHPIRRRAVGSSTIQLQVKLESGGYIMQNDHFDLNDIQHEPSDEQLQALMISVAVEAKRRAELAHEALMQRLRKEIAAANLPHATV